MERPQNLLKANPEAHRGEKLENVMSVNAMKCHKRMLRNKPSVWDLPPSDRLILTLEQVSLVVDVLTEMSSFALPDPVTQGLMVFLKLKDDLMTCKDSLDYSEPTSSQLKAWLAHFQRFQKVASPECVQEAVMLGLLRLRVEDVRDWAHNQ
ncbi:interferon lambda-3-like [Hyperolius riggenbachi]|uniref:interferon lambda-3-like n=1 Tax=Hyperolius riggenbachi TaxID=752182 RepID=UPI0035A3749C